MAFSGPSAHFGESSEVTWGHPGSPENATLDAIAVGARTLLCIMRHTVHGGAHVGWNSQIGDLWTNTLPVIQDAPERLLTLNAEIADRWPEVRRQDGERLASVILFEALSPELTRVESYGVGYGNSPEYESLLGFFVEANKGRYAELKRQLE